jgi:hypothetical protein
MLASELARELQIDASIVSKRLTAYYAEAETPREQYLTDQTIAHMRSAHQLVITKPDMTFKTAIRQVLGKFTAPMSGDSAYELHGRMLALEQQQMALGDKMDKISEYLRQLLFKREGQHHSGNGRTDGAATPDTRLD